MKGSKSMSMGLEAVALALIFAPEPFTTIPGIALLVFARVSKAHRNGDNHLPTRINRFEDYYRYKVEMVRNGQLAYKLAPVREGQLPISYHQTVRLYDTKAWQSYRKSTYSYMSVKKPQQFSGLQKGLLQDMNRGMNRKQY